MGVQVLQYKDGSRDFHKEKRIGEVFGVHKGDVSFTQKFGMIYIAETGRDTLAISACCGKIHKFCCKPAVGRTQKIKVDLIDCCEGNSVSVSWVGSGRDNIGRVISGEYTVEYSTCKCVNVGIPQIAEDIKNRVITDANAPFNAFCQTDSNGDTFIYFVDKDANCPTSITYSNIGVVTEASACEGCGTELGEATHELGFLAGKCVDNKCYNGYIIEYTEVLNNQVSRIGENNGYGSGEVARKFVEFAWDASKPAPSWTSYLEELANGTGFSSVKWGEGDSALNTPLCTVNDSGYSICFVVFNQFTDKTIAEANAILAQQANIDTTVNPQVVQAVQASFSQSATSPNAILPNNMVVYSTVGLDIPQWAKDLGATIIAINPDSGVPACPTELGTALSPVNEFASALKVRNRKSN